MQENLCSARKVPLLDFDFLPIYITAVKAGEKGLLYSFACGGEFRFGKDAFDQGCTW